jgi:hypothetical protein
MSSTGNRPRRNFRIAGDTATMLYDSLQITLAGRPSKSNTSGLSQLSRSG